MHRPVAQAEGREPVEQGPTRRRRVAAVEGGEVLVDETAARWASTTWRANAPAAPAPRTSPTTRPRVHPPAAARPAVAPPRPPATPASSSPTRPSTKQGSRRIHARTGRTVGGEQAAARPTPPAPTSPGCPGAPGAAPRGHAGTVPGGRPLSEPAGVVRPPAARRSPSPPRPDVSVTRSWLECAPSRSDCGGVPVRARTVIAAVTVVLAATMGVSAAGVGVAGAQTAACPG